MCIGKKDKTIDNFFRGYGSVLNIYPEKKVDIFTDDAAALRSDLEAIGQDFHFAVNQYESEEQQKTT